MFSHRVLCVYLRSRLSCTQGVIFQKTYGERCMTRWCTRRTGRQRLFQQLGERWRAGEHAFTRTWARLGLFGQCFHFIFARCCRCHERDKYELSWVSNKIACLFFFAKKKRKRWIKKLHFLRAMEYDLRLGFYSSSEEPIWQTCALVFSSRMPGSRGLL